MQLEVIKEVLLNIISIQTYPEYDNILNLAVGLSLP